MGSKQKFWFCDAQSGHWYLFKYSREQTGEHWSEKIACEIAGILGLPHARVELGRHRDAWGVVIEDLQKDRDQMSLLHGNELLFELDPEYPVKGGYRVSEHTVERVELALERHRVMLPEVSPPQPALPSGVDDAFGLFVGYLLLDAIIGNTDRHHENWAVAVSKSASGSRTLQLAATYDHASSLGRELTDDKRRARLLGKGIRGVEGYADRTRSAFYRTPGDSVPMSPREAFMVAGKVRPRAHAGWLSRCKKAGLEALFQPFDQLHPSSASDAARDFAEALIRYNFQVLFDGTEQAAR
jgi:hypothetical protein